jgi:transketolase
MDLNHLSQIAKELRLLVLRATTTAGSGHPSSCLSAVEVITVLGFGGFLKKKDHLIFSKGHAAPLLYALYVKQGLLSEEKLMALRKFNSVCEGHPMPGLSGIEVATGSLGQGLSVGVGMALADKYLHKSDSHTYVLLGDGEMMEGSNWEACALASYYDLGNVTAIVDINKLEQAGKTAYGWDLSQNERKFQACDWQTILVDEGHNLIKLQQAFKNQNNKGPTAILAKTVKGKGVSILEDSKNWHGKVLAKDQLEQAILELNNNNG